MSTPVELDGLHDLAGGRWLDEQDRAELAAGRLRLPRRPGQDHAAELVATARGLAWVDRDLAAAVRACALLGIVTVESCQGEPGAELDELPALWLAGPRSLRRLLAELGELAGQVEAGRDYGVLPDEPAPMRALGYALWATRPVWAARWPAELTPAVAGRLAAAAGLQ